MKHAAVLMTLEGAHKVVPLEDEVCSLFSFIVFVSQMDILNIANIVRYTKCTKRSIVTSFLR